MKESRLSAGRPMCATTFYVRFDFVRAGRELGLAGQAHRICAQQRAEPGQNVGNPYNAPHDLQEPACQRAVQHAGKLRRASHIFRGPPQECDAVLKASTIALGVRNTYRGAARCKRRIGIHGHDAGCAPAIHVLDLPRLMFVGTDSAIAIQPTAWAADHIGGRR